MSILNNFKNIFKQAPKPQRIPTGFETYETGRYYSQDLVKTSQLNELKGWVGACVTAISDEVGSIQIKLFEQKDDGTIEEINDSPVLDILNRVNEFTTKFDHFWLTQSYLELTGEAPWFLERNSEGEIINIYFLRPDKFFPIPDKNNIVAGYVYKPDSRTTIELSPEDVIFLKILNPANPFRGKGTLEQAQLTVSIERFSEKWNANFFRNSARPELVLKIKDLNQMNEEQRDKLKKSLKESYGGVEKSNQTMVLWGDMDIEPISTSAKDMDFTEQTKLTRDKILGIFRVPKAIIAQTDGVNLANAKTAEFIFARYTIQPKMERLIQQLNEFLLPMFEGTENQFLDFVSPVQEDEKLKLDKIKTGLNQYLTINEVRNAEGLVSVEGGDVLYYPLNLAPIDGEVIDEDTKILKLKTKGKNQPKVKRDRLNQMKALNRDYFNIKDKFKEVKKDAKKLIKKELKDLMKKKQPKTWNADKRFRFWEAKNKIFIKFSPIVKKAFVEIFKAQQKDVIKNLKKELKAQKGIEKKEVKVGDITLSKKKWDKIMFDVTFPLFEEIFKQGGTRTNEFLGIDDEFDVISDKNRGFIDSSTRRLAKGVNDITNEKLTKELNDGLRNNEGIKDLTKRVNRVFGNAKKSRSEMISRTETTRYNENGTEQAYIDSGIVSAKIWQVDGDPCPRCISMQGKVVPLNANFINKGDSDPLGNKMDYSAVGGPPLHPNCNCFIDHQIPIFTSKGWKKIIDIKVGDLVLTHKGRFRKVIKLMRNIKKQPHIVTLEFSFSKQSKRMMQEKLTVTHEHPVLTDKGWVKACEIKKGDNLKVLANYCKACNELIPYFKDYCNKSCASKYTTKKQWENPEHRLNMSNKMSETMKKEWNGKSRNKRLNQLANARTFITECPLSKPENIIKAHRELGRRNYGKTWIEEKVGWVLNENGIKVEPQYPIKKNEKDSLGRNRYYFADFKIKDQDIVIECDGSYWHQDKERDEKRQKEIESKGFTVLRFDENTIRNNLGEVVSEVQRVMSNHSGDYNMINAKVENVKHWNTKNTKTLYNFAVEEDESYIAKGFAVHNCTLVPQFKSSRKDIDKIKKFINYKKKKDIEVKFTDKQRDKLLKLDKKINELNLKINDVNVLKSKNVKGEKDIDKEKQKLIKVREKMIEEYNNDIDEQ